MASSDAILDANRPSPDGREGLRPQIATPVRETASGGRSSVPEPVSADIDWGQPVDDPPPCVEPVGFDEPPPPPPEPASPPDPHSLRRTFLALLQPAQEVGPVAAEAPDPAPVAPPPAVSAAAPPTEPTAAVIAEPAPVAAEAPSSAPVASPPAASAVAPPTEAAGPVIAEPAPAGGRQIPARLLVLVRQWRAAAAIPRLGHRPRLFYGAIGAGAAIVVVGVLYFTGIPFHRSARTAAPVPSAPADRLAYFQRGAQAGDPEAELQLGILYAKGDGVTQDYTTAATWFRMAADQGSARAQYDLGVLYERGRGVAADPEQAASWYLKAAEGKYALAQYNLAVAYTKGQGTRKDLTEAALWYRRAAGQGVVQAMVNLGMLYERGEGIEVSPADAYAWYLAAGRRGNQAAARRAEDVFNGMSRLDQIRAEALASDVAGSIHDAPESGAAPAG
jgi:hypothetical protein